MISSGSTLVVFVLVYLCGLFAVAQYGDRHGARFMKGRTRSVIYALALGVYCTSWTFFGSVGLASRSGFDFLTIYVGPILVFWLGGFMILRILHLAKSQNITSIADFVAARYGKSQTVATIVTLIAVVGVVPYISLQLKAIYASLEVVANLAGGGTLLHMPVLGDLSLYIALLLSAFAIAFGTRRIDAAEHQDGLLLAIALESIVKLVAFLCVGLFVTYGMFDGFGDLFSRVAARADIQHVLNNSSKAPTLFAMTIGSALAALFLPRQFHVAITENRNHEDVRQAAWMFPLYLVLINIFVVPIAIAGLLSFPEGAIDRDMTVLALPIKGGSSLVTLFALLGGISAATAMTIVESVALSIMISNDLVMPALIKLRRGSKSDANMMRIVLVVRRLAILAVMLFGYIYFQVANEAALSSIGLLSFAAIAQIAPALIGGIFWRRATARGAIAGLSIGSLAWFYTLLLPSLTSHSFDIDGFTLADLVQNGPFGILALKPTALFGLHLNSYPHGVFVSLALNILAYVLFSMQRSATPIERLQGNLFAGPEGLSIGQNLRAWRSAVTVEELKSAVGRYLGEERTAKAFEDFMRQQKSHGKASYDPLVAELPAKPREVDAQTLRFAEHLLASAIGAASSRLVLSLLLRRRNLSTKAALKLLDDASAAMQYNRDILQHALDHSRQGVAVYDRDLRIVASNRAFQSLFDLPDEMVRPGRGLAEIIGYNMARGSYGPVDMKEYIALRLDRFVKVSEPFRLRLHPVAKVIEFRSNALPDGGVVTTYTDVTEAVETEEAQARSNETLELRVHERTEELTRVNNELARAKRVADDANLSKTRFLAAASHDILQPLNAARLYASALVEHAEGGANAELARNVDASLDAVEDILTTLLDISRLDAGAMRPELSTFHIDELFRQLKLEFGPAAEAKGLNLRFVSSRLVIRSDRLLLRRLLQNLVSNALKYTPKGDVLLGCRRKGSLLRIEVRDTGLGIPKAKQRLIFQEFLRLDAGSRAAHGLGLGLSIVERIAHVLNHRITVASAPGIGSTFAVDVPLAREASHRAAVPPRNAELASAITGMIVLAIDNEPAILDGLKILLTGWGCRMLTATSLEEARAVIKSSGLKPDILIADYHLDKETGVAAISRLRRRSNSPAILITADRSPEVRELARSLQIEVLNKPVKPGALRALLSQWQRMRLAAE